MKKTLSILLLMAAAAQAHADAVPSGGWSAAWSDLWRNADQRGAALLQHGDAAAAAKAYADPRGKSYAEFKAGDYAAAAQHLAGLDDGEANYNRGNALAYAGKLQEALYAYDAALKRDPGNRDARHNRDLVAQALKQQQQQQDPKQNGKQHGKQEQKQGQGQGQNGQQQDKNSRQNQNAQQNANPAGSRGSSQGNGGKGQSNDAKSSAAPPSDAANPAAGANAPKPSAAGQTPQQASGQTPDSAPKPGSAAPAGTDGGAGMNAAGDESKDKPAPAQTPQSETQIARDQWLRGIPDDPGGLLRRKFLIEHMIRQQGAQP